eukprot:4616721-Pleurochrysis_carterae.AAC.2
MVAHRACRARAPETHGVSPARTAYYKKTCLYAEAQLNKTAFPKSCSRAEVLRHRASVMEMCFLASAVGLS